MNEPQVMERRKGDRRGTALDISGYLDAIRTATRNAYRLERHSAVPSLAVMTEMATAVELTYLAEAVIRRPGGNAA